ncbi:MAG: shikimate dehydrogenase [Anaerolineales bacterium]|nr:shikimate dehydrogenase [Anaerolineales bacterium]MCB9146574.1 shikimate dehydrogenase [Anaerolineales bacterium]
MNPNLQLPITNYKLGLIGYPLGHSLSPKIHTAALQASGLEGNYSLFPIPPEDKQALQDLLAQVRAGEIHGLNVTIPHKQNVIEFMDELMPTAQAIGAVNTIYMRGDKLIGDNTDAPGFLADLKRFIGDWRLEIGDSALVFGAGGSARAVVYALLNDGWNVTLAARRIEQAQQLAASFTKYQLQTTDNSSFFIPHSSLIINTTPLGMTPNTETSPLPEGTELAKHTFVYDLVYNPRETKLVKTARAQGLNAFTGLGMLIEQAALAFEKWTGHTPPREILFDAVGATRPD